jgi:uncharacterized protein (DUF1330 family)
MPAYLIVNLEITDQAAFASYRAGVSTVVQKHGGDYLVRGGNTRVLEGDSEPQRLVVLASPIRSPWTRFGTIRSTNP